MPAPDMQNLPWFYNPGVDSDVAVSTRVRLARNLTDFVFPRFLSRDDAERIHSLVYDACSSYKDGCLRFMPATSLEPTVRSLFAERGIIAPEDAADPRCGIILDNDGCFSCTLNSVDHVRIVSFRSGFNLNDCYQEVLSLDTVFQDHLQFAADGDFGYLTSSLKDTGSGMKASVMLHLPALSITSTIERVIRDVIAAGFVVNGFYNTKDNNSLGAFFLVSTANAGKGSVQEQLDGFSAVIARIIDAERKTLAQLKALQPTMLEDMTFRALAIARNARFISLRESIEIISRIKLGVNARILPDIKNDRLFALLYTIKNAHIRMQLPDIANKFCTQISSDIQDEDQKINRMRALIIQQYMNDIKGD